MEALSLCYYCLPRPAFFLEDYYPANKFRAIIIHLYERAGFMEAMRQFETQMYGVRPPLLAPEE